MRPASSGSAGTQMSSATPRLWRVSRLPIEPRRVLLQDMLPEVLDDVDVQWLGHEPAKTCGSYIQTRSKHREACY